MSYNLYDLIDERMIRRNLCVPRVQELAHDDRYEGVKLQVNLIAAGERRQQQLLYRLRSPATFAIPAGCLVRASRSPNK